MGIVFFALTSVAHAEEKKDAPKSDQYIIVNKAVNKLAFYEDGRLVHIFSVATGASASSTPEGDFHVSVKWECPVYYKGKNGPCEYGNPLGPRWIGLDVPGTAGYTYGIHGNAAEWSIGTYASAGCVRMHNWQVTQLFDIVKYNTPVTIIRSDKSFDEIAKDKGYVVKKSQKKQERVTLVGKTPLYYGAHTGLPLNEESLENKEVKIIESIGDWKKIETLDDEKKTYWTNTQNIVAGKVTEETTYVLVEKDGIVYTYPTQESKITNMKKPIILSSSLHVGDWNYVKLSEKQSGWVKLDEVKKVTEHDWDTQENMSSYAKEWMQQWQEYETKSNDFWNIVNNLFA